MDWKQREREVTEERERIALVEDRLAKAVEEHPEMAETARGYLWSDRKRLNHWEELLIQERAEQTGEGA